MLGRKEEDREKYGGVEEVEGEKGLNQSLLLFGKIESNESKKN